jgi:dTDP-4-dehydrorhamnose 3,5-epimerase
MKVIASSLPGVCVIEPSVFGDQRGFFMETYQQQRYMENGIDATFVQDNISLSVQNTLRGLHYQHPRGQAKLVQVLQGEVFDVAVDIRKGSPTWGQWFGAMLSSENKRQMFIPDGYAHGFCVTSETALFAYKCGDFYMPENEGGIRWDDPDIGIQWPINTPILSDRDKSYTGLKGVAEERLPVYTTVA